MIVLPLTCLRRTDLAEAGGKAINLGELLASGVDVPVGFVVTTRAYRWFVEANALDEPVTRLVAEVRPDDPAGAERASAAIGALFARAAVPPEISSAVTSAYGALSPDGGLAVAVRSSATAEDLAEASFAGQQETFLNVHGAEQVLAAVQRCWASLFTARALVYRARQTPAPTDVALAVVVQELVDARSSGVMFTANPNNGRRAETVISAAWGLGEAVVSGAVTTDDLVIDTDAWQVISRSTADKRVMTVRTADGTEEAPVPAERRRAPALDDVAAITLARLGGRIEAEAGCPQDVEWVLDTDGRLRIVQARAITALPEPTGPTPTTWPVSGSDYDVWIRGSIIEQMPDPLSPLFADLAGRHVVPAMIETITELIPGQTAMTAADFGFETVNGYGYYAYRNALMAKMFLVLPRAMPVIFKGSGVARWREVFRPRYQSTVSSWAAASAVDRSSAELLAGIGALVRAGFAYYTSVQTVIPACATSELSFAGFYEKLIRRAGDPAADTFLVGFDSEPIRADKSLHALAGWVRDHQSLVAALVGAGSGEAARTTAQPAGPLGADQLGHEPPDGVTTLVWQQFQARLREHLERFGHAVYNLDIVNPVAADEPGPVLDGLRFYLSGQGQNPTVRQQKLATRREAATRSVRRRLDPARRATFDRLLASAQRLVPIREDALADVGLAWPTVRQFALELGRRLVATGALSRAEDVFWLHESELACLATQLDGDADRERPPGADEPAAVPAVVPAVVPTRELVAARRATWRGQRLVSPPAILPEDSRWHAFDRVMPNVMEDQTGPVIRGTAASGGTVTGPARVLRSPEEFSSMRPGEVLVAAITTPAWTPLFAMAAGVVTDIGGPLSHSSIVAREYGIPAVLGTTVASSRIRTGQEITVDGEAGTVTLVDEVGQGSDTAPGQSRRGSPGRVRLLVGGLTLVAGALAVRATCKNARARAVNRTPFIQETTTSKGATSSAIFSGTTRRPS